MAELFEEKITITITRAVKSGVTPPSIVSSDMVSSLEAVMAELLETPAVVEIKVS